MIYSLTKELTSNKLLIQLSRANTVRYSAWRTYEVGTVLVASQVVLVSLPPEVGLYTGNGDIAVVPPGAIVFPQKAGWDLVPVNDGL
jgi:hypothetical protein